MFEGIQDKAASVESWRQDIHERSERTLTHVLLMVVFYGALTISVLGIVILVAAWILTKQQG